MGAMKMNPSGNGASFRPIEFHPSPGGSVMATATTATTRKGILARADMDHFGPAVLSGFVATTAMAFVAMIAYFAAEGIGHAGSGTLATWFRNLTNNPVTDTVRSGLIGVIGLNLAIGLVWATVFAFDANERLKQYPGWLRGVLFIIPPYLLSLVLLPIVPGAGFAGLGLQAGPLPILGNLILHLVYGVVLGAVYVLEGSVDGVRNNDPGVQASLHSAETKAGLSVLVGAGAGIVLAVIGSAIAVGLSGPVVVGAAVGGAVIGAAIGAVFGAVTGLTDQPVARPTPTVDVSTATMTANE